jgi:hypothetical protein
MYQVRTITTHYEAAVRHGSTMTLREIERAVHFHCKAAATTTNENERYIHRTAAAGYRAARYFLLDAVGGRGK